MSISIKELDSSLSLKLGDPVQDNGDGGIFDWQDRLKYLERAFGKLLRILPKLMKTQTPLFAMSNNYIKKDLTAIEEKKGNGIQVTEDEATVSIDNVKELFVHVAGGKNTFYGKATYINSDKYLSVMNGDNTEYTPSEKNNDYFYTFLSDGIYLLPVLSGSEGSAYKKVSLVCKKDSEKFTEETMVPIPYEYNDLLIEMAAYEGMRDLGRGDKAGLYNAAINNELSILKGYADNKEAQEGSDLNG